MIDRNKLYPWQNKAYDKWIENNKQGIVIGCTASGKTLLALYCIQECKCSTIIIVPTIALLLQWKQEVLKHLDITEDKVGLYYGKIKELKSITIAVINSVRPKDLSGFDCCVVDELHNMASFENIKPLERSNFKFKIGLTATLTREDGKEKLLKQCIGKVVYTYDQKTAIDDDVLSKFTLVNVGVNLKHDEQQIYDEKDIIVKNGMRTFNYNFPQVMKSAKNYRDPNFHEACKLLKAINTRRMIYSNSKSKIDEVLKLCKQHKDEQIIIFNEYIGMAENIYHMLIEHCYNVGIYHSKSKDLNVIKDFTDKRINILVAVKSLNEGLNVKSASVGIQVSGNTVKRGMIQRLGRVIRREDGKRATFYQIYCRYTKESKDVIKRTNLLRDIAMEVILK